MASGSHDCRLVLAWICTDAPDEPETVNVKWPLVTPDRARFGGTTYLTVAKSEALPWMLISEVPVIYTLPSWPRATACLSSKDL